MILDIKRGMTYVAKGSHKISGYPPPSTSFPLPGCRFKSLFRLQISNRKASIHTERPSLIDVVNKYATIANPNLNTGNRLSGCHPRKKLARHFGKYGSCKNVIDVAGSAFDLFTTVRNLGHHGVLVSKISVVVFFDSSSDSTKLELDDFAHHFIGNRVIRHNDHSAEQGGLEYFYQLGSYSLNQSFRLRASVRIGAQLNDSICGCIRG